MRGRDTAPAAWTYVPCSASLSGVHFKNLFSLVLRYSNNSLCTNDDLKKTSNSPLSRTDFDFRMIASDTIAGKGEACCFGAWVLLLPFQLLHCIPASSAISKERVGYRSWALRLLCTCDSVPSVKSAGLLWQFPWLQVPKWQQSTIKVVSLEDDMQTTPWTTPWTNPLWLLCFMLVCRVYRCPNVDCIIVPPPSP